MGIKVLFLFVVILSNSIEARPISYSGGSTLMGFSDNMMDSIYYHYSPTYKYSIGVESVQNKYFNEKYLQIFNAHIALNVSLHSRGAPWDQIKPCNY